MRTASACTSTLYHFTGPGNRKGGSDRAERYENLSVSSTAGALNVFVSALPGDGPKKKRESKAMASASSSTIAIVRPDCVLCRQQAPNKAASDAVRMLCSFVWLCLCPHSSRCPSCPKQAHSVVVHHAVYVDTSCALHSFRYSKQITAFPHRIFLYRKHIAAPVVSTALRGIR